MHIVSRSLMFVTAALLVGAAFAQENTDSAAVSATVTAVHSLVVNQEGTWAPADWAPGSLALDPHTVELGYASNTHGSGETSEIAVSVSAWTFNTDATDHANAWPVLTIANGAAPSASSGAAGSATLVEPLALISVENVTVSATDIVSSIANVEGASAGFTLSLAFGPLVDAGEYDTTVTFTLSAPAL